MAAKAGMFERALLAFEPGQIVIDIPREMFARLPGGFGSSRIGVGGRDRRGGTHDYNLHNADQLKISSYGPYGESEMVFRYLKRNDFLREKRRIRRDQNRVRTETRAVLSSSTSAIGIRSNAMR